ncbi:hypothetical protein os1_30170 [Comamonadaceae bacterium OS-1]|nr:hypothetical protein os1_30170 [Comamonadaceae bacterium OS-1]
MGEDDPNKERLELALEAAGLDLWENNLRTGEVTRKALKTFSELGYTNEEVLHHIDHLFEFIHPDDVAMIQSAVEAHMAGRTPEYRCEFRMRAKNGDWVWYANYGRIMDAASDTPGQRFIGVTFNINDRRRKEEEIDQANRQLAAQNTLLHELNTALELLAANDPLTGLANRRTLLELGANECKRAERFQHPLSVLMVDIDNFKRVNDTWGHLAGDHVICAVADTCRQRIRMGLDTVARLGGEEFVVLLPETDTAGASRLAESLRQAVAVLQVQAPDVPGIATCTVSIGIATFSPPGATFEQLLHRADTALYQAKQAGRNQVQAHAPR